MEETIVALLQTINDDITADSNIDLLTNGIIDSFDVVNIVAGLEEKFKIEIEAEDIVPEHFATISAIVNLVEKYSRN